MLKNISNLGKTLNKAAQQSINGGVERGRPACNSPYIKADSSEVCVEGFHDHPTQGHCTCCRD